MPKAGLLMHTLYSESLSLQPAQLGAGFDEHTKLKQK
jgi:hypothetical protein